MPPRSQTWWIRYTINGVQHRRNTGHTDEAQALVFAANTARLVGLAQGESSLDEKQRLFSIAEGLLKDIRELEGKGESLGRDKNLPTVRQWFDRRLEEMKNGSDGDDRHLKASSLARIENVHGRWLAHLEGLPVPLADAPMNRISPDEVRSFLAESKKQGLSGATRRYALAQIRAVFGRALDQGLLSSNPAGVKRVGRLKFDDKSIRRAFNPQQIAAILNAAETCPPWLKLSALLGVFSGQRAGDICAMRWEDIRNLDSALPTITITQQKSKNVVVVPIAEPLKQALKGVPETQRHGFLLGHVAEAYLEGHRRRFIRAWRELLNAVNLPSLADPSVVSKIERSGEQGRTRFAWSFHSWRHTTATYLSGPDAHYLLGHRSDGERSLGQTAQYRHEDLQRLKLQLDVIPVAQPENLVALAVNS
jgi:integrase